MSEVAALKAAEMDSIKPTELEPISSTLKNAISDTSWIHEKSPWHIKPSDLLNVSVPKEAQGLGALLLAEQRTSQILVASNSNNEFITSVATQVASMHEAYSETANRWNNLIYPVSLIYDLADLAANQHREIQKLGEASLWRLGILDAASRFADQQIKWTNGFIAGLPDIIEEDTETGNKPIESYAAFKENLYKNESNAIPLLSQCLGYTNRKDINKTIEEGLENSLPIVITEKGKSVVDKAMQINKLCAVCGYKNVFPLSDKLIENVSVICSIVCTSKETKKIVTDKAVREEKIYQCIFRVKTIRTDFRHDINHGKDIEEKKKRIENTYRHYTNKPVLVRQREFVKLQDHLYDEFLLLEDSLIDLLNSKAERENVEG